MKIICESPRLLLREFLPEDATGIFALDSNPAVLQFIDTPVLTDISQAEALVARIITEKKSRGIARLAVVLKSNQQFIGWAGLKWMTEEVNGHRNFHDLGYRFLQNYWGQGYGLEAAQATWNYAFDQLQLERIYAVAHTEHFVSQKILRKIGMVSENEFEWYGAPHVWFVGKRE